MVEDFGEAKTTVFWDVEDFPNPNDRSIYEIIKSALEKLGYHGELSIKAYGEKKPDNLNLEDDSVITFYPKRGKIARANKMLLDICFWSIPYFRISDEHVNLLVIAKTILKETPLVSELRFLHDLSNGNVILVVANDCKPEETPLPTNISTVWLWESLLDGGEPLSPDKLDELFARVVESETYNSETDEDPSSEDEEDGSEDDDDDLEGITCRFCNKVY